VVGAGITGLSTAYLLALEGMSVAVVESGFVGQGMTGRTTAHLSNVIDDHFTTIERIHGVDGMRLAAASHRSAIETISRVVVRESIDCGFEYVDGYLFAGRGHTEAELNREADSATRAGVEVERLAAVPIPHFHTGPCLRFPYQAQFHASRYLDGLLRACLRLGVQVYTDSHVRSLESGKRCMVRVQKGAEVHSAHLVVATNVPINVPVSVHLKQSAWMTFVVGAVVPKDVVPRVLLWDMEDPYHYVRTQPLDDRLDVILVGGEDRRTGEPSDDDVLRYERLREWTRQRFPLPMEFPYRWSGQVMETADGLAYIGRNTLGKSNVFIATGDSGMGMTHGTIAGLLLTDLIMGRDNPWERLYSPLRLKLRALPRLLKDEVAMARHYARWTGPAEGDDPWAIPPGEGRVVNWDGEKVAAYKGSDNQVCLMAAACPHLGGIVAWNDTEKTWDCGCHGSRFTCHGKVLSGPARDDMTPLLSPTASAVQE
jgi:glycine/D-amino acid oxidase-like deaminating enzyme/nitrite reductase/ring-hydroxylating ferredoxin subunit